ncbi:hypothetical protein HPB47_020932 [Ixodes persulcatus]|uniref:Uncharacterized protein n=1 Tax=Ixodes persulcatus TaxID=34615 RepID=A0AC60QE17_IXOPE|nr:hypothetical protein HPB47_020932 [Ixodes persulcatus]
MFVSDMDSSCLADGCSSRSTPKPRAPQSTVRPNITFQTYTCPEAYAKWYCLNGATCFAIKIGESILYNCECADGYMGQRRRKDKTYFDAPEEPKLFFCGKPRNGTRDIHPVLKQTVSALSPRLSACLGSSVGSRARTQRPVEAHQQLRCPAEGPHHRLRRRREPVRPPFSRVTADGDAPPLRRVICRAETRKRHYCRTIIII